MLSGDERGNRSPTSSTVALTPTADDDESELTEDDVGGDGEEEEEEEEEEVEEIEERYREEEMRVHSPLKRSGIRTDAEGLY